MANSFNICFEDVLNLGKQQFSFAGIVYIGDDVLKNADKLDNNVKKGDDVLKNADKLDNNVKKSNSNNINNNSAPGIEIKSDIITDGSHLEKGRLKSHVRYKTGEYDYIYETDSKVRIYKFEINNLQLTERKERLKHDQKTPSKIGCDHTEHLVGDEFNIELNS